MAESERAAVAAERAILERRVALLKPGHPHPDMLDERAREMLNLIGPDEVLILTPDK
ncbi:cell division protein FtsB [Roseospira marina]|nr:cell division protein FtsB [Roseospira marina]MBB5085816.1 cell division protein FtsB [Roseospira marina]